MLKQRVITAILLVAFLLPALFHHDPMWLALMAALMVACGTWEWWRLNGASEVSARWAGFISALMIAAWVWSPLQLQDALMLLPVLMLSWGLCWALMLWRGGPAWSQAPSMLRRGWGIWALWMTWAALYQFKLIGVNFLLSTLCLVWAADIGAYFAGRRWGKRKLAPSLSPGKSWEGVVGGVVAVMALAWTWMLWDQMGWVDSPSLFTQTWYRWGPLAMWSWALLVAASVLGDLFESMVKRVAGVKDSSGLLPGHGGVLDRIDALLPTLPLVLWVLSW